MAAIKYKWFQIGVLLGIHRHKLKEFEQENDPLAAVIDYWLKGNVDGIPRTWESIVAAFKSGERSESNLANRLKRKYCLKEGEVDNSGKTTKKFCAF